jgi:hypothetical protein
VCSALKAFALVLFGWLGAAPDTERTVQAGSLDRMLVESGVGANSTLQPMSQLVNAMTILLYFKCANHCA